MITYQSTRSPEANFTLDDVILAGLARDGGLYVPTSLPSLDMAALKGASYLEVAYAVLSPFFAGSRLEGRLKDLLADAYGDQFRDAEKAPLVKLDDRTYVLELFHGPTLAFKDFALQLLGRLFDALSDGSDKKLTILGATSGDTGSAAIEACRGRANVRVFMLHPKGRVSDVQRRQMTTILDEGVHNIAVEGSFDDCQNMVKESFGDLTFRDTVNLTAVNSINWARILGQIVYYVWACLKLDASEGKPSFSVPTGNFGDIYAGYLAKKMGAPIGDLIIATNANDILVRTLETGVYARGDAQISHSPSMDIQVASNFERLLLDAYGGDTTAVRAALASLKAEGRFTLSDDALAFVRDHFKAARVDDPATLVAMQQSMSRWSYYADPHTAIGFKAAQDCDSGNGPLVILATAHPAKFAAASAAASLPDPTLPTHMADLMDRPERMTDLEADTTALKAMIEVA